MSSSLNGKKAFRELKPERNCEQQNSAVCKRLAFSLDYLALVGLPGSVGAAGRPPTTLHCFVLVWSVSAVVAFATQSELQRLVQTVSLQAAQVHLHCSHLRGEQTVSLCQQLIG